MKPKTPNKPTYLNAAVWHAAAMQRSSLCDANKSRQRQTLADAHNQQNNIRDSNTLADQQLYIQGKMDKDEYQDYLLFKHSKQTSV